jgi:steroid 5-alpha reductase family enzyme
MRERWGGDSTYLLSLMMFIFQGFLIVLISLPFFIVCHSADDVWSQWEWIGIAICLVGIAGEAFADKQLADFVKDPANKGKVCRNGLWRFSRHPNYFFDVVVWVGFFLFALPSPGGSLAILSPLIVLFLVIKVSGIPLAEAHSVESKGEAYQEYQRTTSPFLPWFPKD